LLVIGYDEINSFIWKHLKGHLNCSGLTLCRDEPPEMQAKIVTLEITIKRAGRRHQVFLPPRPPTFRATDIKSQLNPGFLRNFGKSEKLPFPLPLHRCGVFGSGSEHPRNRIFSPLFHFSEAPQNRKYIANHANLTHRMYYRAQLRLCSFWSGDCPETGDSLPSASRGARSAVWRRKKIFRDLVWRPRANGQAANQREANSAY
jgi:hypothetical protein